MAGFTIPNTPSAYNQNQAEPDSLDFQILGNHKNAVVSGMEVTPGASGATVAVSAGEVIVNGVYYSFAGSASIALTAYSTTPFFDLVVARLSSGSISCVVLPGNAGTNPQYPAITADDVVLAAVWRPDNNNPLSSMVVDKRLFVRSADTRLASGTPASGTGSNGDLYVNSSWSADSTLAGPISVKVGGTWYQLARYSSTFSSGTITANLTGNVTGNLTGTASNASALSSLVIHSGRNNEANKIVRTDGNGYLQVGYVNSSNGDENNASSPPRVWGTNGSDSYLRTYQSSSVRVGYSYRLSSTWDNTTQLEGTLYGVKVTDHISPETDNAYALGGFYYAGNYIQYPGWSNITTWAIYTISDERLKTDVQPSELGLDFINSLNPVSYKVIVGKREVKEDGSIIEHDGVRRHFGFIAQDVKEVADNTSVDDFAGWALGNPQDPDSRQSLNYLEFIAPMVKAIQELSARIEALEAQ